MQEELEVALIQTDLIWENPEQNRMNLTLKIEEINQEVNLILLPEMFTSGFTMSPENVAETMNGDTIKWMLEISKNSNAAIGGSLVIKEDDLFYNRFVFVQPTGEITTYNKRHTFTLAGEDKKYTSGDERIIIDYLGWRICPLVCYDLRFPVWARNSENYDLLCYVANWPQPRITAWDTLLKARAIENMSYCIGVNRVGFDINGHNYSGHSAAYDSLGALLTDFKDNTVEIKVVTLSKTHLNSSREKLRFLNDKDEFTLK